MRGLVRETHLEPSQLILPLFACPGEGVRREIGSMPGNFQLSIDELVKECEATFSLGVGGVILFGIPEVKDDRASGAYDENGIVQRAVRAVKSAVPGLLVITDVCNCEYTDHGHCGKIVNGEVDNDATLAWLAEAAVSHARAGADIVAPSDMMDGRVAAIRHSLDAFGFTNTPDPLLRRQIRLGLLMVRFAKPPNRRPNSATAGATRWTRQRARGDARNGARSRRGRGHADGETGHALSRPDSYGARPFPRPDRRYQVSGEFSMIVAAARNGWLDLDRAMMESLISIRRAGAGIILYLFRQRRGESVSLICITQRREARKEKKSRLLSELCLCVKMYCLTMVTPAQLHRWVGLTAVLNLALIAILLGRPHFSNASRPVRGVSNPIVAMEVVRNVSRRRLDPERCSQPGP